MMTRQGLPGLDWVVLGLGRSLGSELKLGGCLDCGVDMRSFEKSVRYVEDNFGGLNIADIVAVANELVARDTENSRPLFLDQDGHIECNGCGAYALHLLIATTMVMYGLDAKTVRQAVESKK